MAEWWYQPGLSGRTYMPLERFLPPLRSGTAAACLDEMAVPPATWVLDPFGSSPAAALEAAASGRRVLVCAANPVHAFLIEFLANPPDDQEVQSALAELAQSRRNGEQLETVLRSLYLVPCAACGQLTEALAFLWHRGEQAPYASLVHCAGCGADGEQLFDRSHPLPSALGQDGLHRSRALARAAGPEASSRADVQEALESYLPRPLFVLQTLINRIEGPGFTPAQRRILHALLLDVCDQGSALWPLAGRSRPRQLVVPGAFRENNLWLALEESARNWGRLSGMTALVAVADGVDWDQALPQGGIALFRGRVRELPAALPHFTAGLTVLPRPNQAFWTLSAVWASWLWGRESARALQGQLSRRRYDWNWHAAALHSPLRTAAHLIPRGGAMVCLVPEAAAGFCAAVAAASFGAGWTWDGHATRADQEMLQVLLRSPGPGLEAPAAASIRQWQEGEQAFSKAVFKVLALRGEPSPYLPLYTAGLAAAGMAGGFPLAPGENETLAGDVITRIQALAARVFAQNGLIRHSLGSQEDEGSLWEASAEAGGGESPLADRTEMETVRVLQGGEGLTLEQIDRAVCGRLRGSLTPAVELLAEVVASYGRRDAAGLWRLSGEEEPAARRRDLAEVNQLLGELGARLDYQVSGELPLVWTPRSFGRVYQFYGIASAVISRHVPGGMELAGKSGPPGRPAVPGKTAVPGGPAVPGAQTVMVFPGGRAKLIAWKLTHNPRLAQALSSVHLLKFRHLRNLAQQIGLTRGQWESLLDADPPFFDEAEQMRLL